MSVPAELAFAFPGVGVRFSGHEAAFAEQHPGVLARLAAASERTGVDLGAALRDGGTDGLSELDAQRFAFAFGCGVADAVDRQPAVVVGYSLGLYAAVVAGGALAFEDGLACVDAAWAAMRGACPESCGLAVIVGLDRAEVARCLGADVQIVNQNHAAALVIAGPDAALDETLAAATALDALKAVRLRAGLPYHHPSRLRAAVPELAAFLATLSWRDPRCPVLSCIDQAWLRDPTAVRDEVARNIATPIHWQRTVEAMSAAGVREVVECGAGLSLTQNARMLDAAPRFTPLRVRRST